MWFGDAEAHVICMTATPAQTAAHEAELVPGVPLQLSQVAVHERHADTLIWVPETVVVVGQRQEQQLAVLPI